MTATYTCRRLFHRRRLRLPKTRHWGGYWGKQGPELLDHRLALYSEEQRMVFGANTYQQFVGSSKCWARTRGRQGGLTPGSRG